MQSIFSKIFTKDTPYLAHRGEVWDVFCGFSLWLIFCTTSCNGECNDLLDRVITALRCNWNHYSEPRMRCCHNLPPGSLHILGYFSHIQRGISLLNWCKLICIIRIHSTETYKYDFSVFQCTWSGLQCFLWIFMSVDIPTNPNRTCKKFGCFYAFGNKFATYKSMR